VKRERYFLFGFAEHTSPLYQFKNIKAVHTQADLKSEKLRSHREGEGLGGGWIPSECCSLPKCDHLPIVSQQK